LGPVIIFGFARTDFTAPVEREAYFVELLAIAVDISFSSDCGMLSGLNSVLFRWQTICVISHRIEYIEATQSFVTGVNIRSDVSQRMPYMQSGP